MCEKIGMGYREAHELLNWIHSKRRNVGKKIPKRVYFCEECHLWHLTSQSVAAKDKKKFELA